MGGGPAGSALAWRLCEAGLDVVILEKEGYPREKLCAGWITLAVVEALKLDVSEYASRRTLQPISAFVTGRIGGSSRRTDYGRTVSYGIRRSEFDFYLARRSGARIVENTSAAGFRRENGEWIVNDEYRAPLLVGAGGHYCPVARLLGARPHDEASVVTQEVEVPMGPDQQASCRVRGDTPELYFCRDLRGYGWCFRKDHHLNVGLGRMSRSDISRCVQEFLAFLRGSGRIPLDLSWKMRGHAYLLYGLASRTSLADGTMLIGDAAGLAHPLSGEGIRPAVESALMAAQVILAARGDYSRKRLEPYGELLAARLGKHRQGWRKVAAALMPELLIPAFGAAVLGSRFLTRRLLLDSWFLHLPAGRR